MAKGKFDEWLTDDGLFKLQSWKRDGLTDEQIAFNIGINVRVLYRWKNRFSQISLALKSGKDEADYIVENELFKSTQTRTIRVRKPVKLKTKKQIAGKGTVEEERIEYVDEDVVIPANVTAQIFWLKNRKSKAWSDRPAVPVNQDTSGREQFLSAIGKSVTDEYVRQLFGEEDE